MHEGGEQKQNVKVYSRLFPRLFLLQRPEFSSGTGSALLCRNNLCNVQLRAKTVPSHLKTTLYFRGAGGTTGRLQVLQKYEFPKQMVGFDGSWLIFLLGWTFLFMSGLKPEWPCGFPHSVAVENVSVRR